MINRQALITRHNPCYSALNKNAPLSVGNGTFCFTSDFTGLQTFFEDYARADDAFPLCTMAEWGWHSYPPLPGWNEGPNSADLRATPYDTYGRTVYYASDETGQEEQFRHVRQSAHKFHLGKIGFEFAETGLSLDECEPVRQLLDLWEGILSSEFILKGETVNTETFVHPAEDTVYFRVRSPLLKNSKLHIVMVFPYGSHKKSAADFNVPAKHSTRVTECSCAFQAGTGMSNGTLAIDREMDLTRYRVIVNGCGFTAAYREEFHTIVLYPQHEAVEFSVRFEPVRVPAFDSAGGLPAAVPASGDAFGAALEKCKNFWHNYWQAGGAVDFSGSSDSRAAELERRIVLSQYLIAIQSRGVLPPAETGHTCNSWYGKFHLEMHYWHHAYFPLWSRPEELKRTLGYYKTILPRAREIATSQGYAGARWPKMCDPSGANTPSSVAVLLLWQQPHPIMLAELCWRACPDESFLREYRDIIVETAEFMNSFVHWENNGYCVVGPPYFPAQERHDPRIVLNAAYELEYFRWGFRQADVWLERLGELPRYGAVAEKLKSPAIIYPPRGEGVYLAHENCPNTFSELPFYTDHPSMLAMYGILNSEKIDKDRMSATLGKVLAVWDKTTFYGWDFPMMAMTACRLGRYADAIGILLMDSPKNSYMENGHNRMAGDNALPLYLPGNGGLLLAIAMLAAGFGDTGGGAVTGPVFPAGFTVEAEGIHAYI